MSSRLQNVKGMNDILPDSVDAWHNVEKVLARVSELYGYREIRTPVLESTELFRHAIGEQTDIVDKEMYTFDDLGGNSMTMRPENTAACVRAGIQHGLFFNRHARLWYLGPMFRFERPQKGRYRQFHQFGIEQFGMSEPACDVEILLFGERLWSELELRDLTLKINTLGSAGVRTAFREALVDHFQANRDVLDDDSVNRLTRNPLRILDSKNPAMQEVIDAAPSILDFLDAETGSRFDTILRLLAARGVDYQVDSRLVRGLDYYSSTVFEWVTGSLGAQNAVCGGGRYDLLVEQFGGRPTPGAGFAIGLERLVELVGTGPGTAGNGAPDAFLCYVEPGFAQFAIETAENLRGHGVSVEFGGAGRLRSMMKKADASGARVAVIIGESEHRDRMVSVKDLRGDGRQQTLPLPRAAAHIRGRQD